MDHTQNGESRAVSIPTDAVMEAMEAKIRQLTNETVMMGARIVHLERQLAQAAEEAAKVAPAESTGQA